MLTTNDPALYERLKLTRSHGQAGKYFHTCLGFNYRMTDVEAAIGLRQLERLSEMVARRRANAEYLSSKLKDIQALQTPVVQPQGTHSFNQYCITLNLESLNCTRDEFAAELNHLGVGTGVHYPRCLHQQPVFNKLGGSNPLPVSERQAESILALPVHPFLQKEELDSIVSAVRLSCERLAK